MRWFGHYLHTAGWNVYMPILAGHAFKGDAWPQVHLKAEYGGDGALAAAVAANPDVAAAVATAADPAAMMGALTAAVPQLAGAGPPDAYVAALEGGPAAADGAFDARFDSTAAAYGAGAEAALTHVAGLPGSVVAVGSSVGGATALWLGGAAARGRVSHVVACAPLLRLHDPDRRRLALTVGPLGVGPEQGWTPTNRFPLACHTGTFFFFRAAGAGALPSGEAGGWVCGGRGVVGWGVRGPPRWEPCVFPMALSDAEAPVPPHTRGPLV